MRPGKRTYLHHSSPPQQDLPDCQPIDKRAIHVYFQLPREGGRPKIWRIQLRLCGGIFHLQKFFHRKLKTCNRFYFFSLQNKVLLLIFQLQYKRVGTKIEVDFLSTPLPHTLQQSSLNPHLLAKANDLTPLQFLKICIGVSSSDPTYNTRLITFSKPGYMWYSSKEYLGISFIQEIWSKETPTRDSWAYFLCQYPVVHTFELIVGD